MNSIWQESFNSTDDETPVRLTTGNKKRKSNLLSKSEKMYNLISYLKETTGIFLSLSSALS